MYVPIMIGLRSTAFRVLSRQNNWLSSRSRSFHTVIPFTTRVAVQRSSAFQLQRRFASSEEAQTQGEPEADGAQPQDGNNSIAASERGQEERSTSSHEQEHSSLGELAESAADKAKETASNAYEAIAGGSGASRNTEREVAAPGSNLYVGNLFFDVREDDLRKRFEQCGTIENVKLIMDNRGLSKG
ncbi:MAG: hypothetical protein Q9226_005243, partial [Calogaya cf. arnoldii]